MVLMRRSFEMQGGIGEVALMGQQVLKLWIKLEFSIYKK
jgi:hypothetical protein